jgi:hypothetical protein
MDFQSATPKFGRRQFMNTAAGGLSGLALGGPAAAKMGLPPSKLFSNGE